MLVLEGVIHLVFFSYHFIQAKHKQRQYNNYAYKLSNYEEANYNNRAIASLTA